MSQLTSSSSTVIATGADAHHFANVTMLVASWRVHHPGVPLLVCDYGMTAKQVAVLNAIAGVSCVAPSGPRFSHAWEGKARLGEYAAAIGTPWDTLIWIDADAIFLQPLPDVAELIEGYQMIIDAHLQSIGAIMHECNRDALQVRSDDAYFSSGFWIVRRGCLLDSYARLAALVKGQGNLWENDAFVAAIYREKLKLRTVNGGVWHARGKTSLHTCEVSGLQAFDARQPIYVLHANDGYTTRADGRRVFKRPELAAIQDYYEEFFWREIAPAGERFG